MEGRGRKRLVPLPVRITGTNFSAKTVIYVETKTEGDVVKNGKNYKTVSFAGVTDPAEMYLDFVTRLDDEKTARTVIVDVDGSETAYSETTYTLDFTGITAAATE